MTHHAYECSLNSCRYCSRSSSSTRANASITRLRGMSISAATQSSHSALWHTWQPAQTIAVWASISDTRMAIALRTWPHTFPAIPYNPYLMMTERPLAGLKGSLRFGLRELRQLRFCCDDAGFCYLRQIH